MPKTQTLSVVASQQSLRAFLGLCGTGIAALLTTPLFPAYWAADIPNGRPASLSSMPLNGSNCTAVGRPLGRLKAIFRRRIVKLCQPHAGPEQNIFGQKAGIEQITSTYYGLPIISAQAADSMHLC
jgi:hypothetical protein